MEDKVYCYNCQAKRFGNVCQPIHYVSKYVEEYTCGTDTPSVLNKDGDCKFYFRKRRAFHTRAPKYMSHGDIYDYREKLHYIDY